MNALDLIGIRETTDKSLMIHDYLRHYDRAFEKLRLGKLTVMEIGVLAGASLRMWADYFPHAEIVGVDVNNGARNHATERIRIEIGSQDDPAFLGRLASRYAPDIIIDDGSHFADDVTFTFERLFPCLRPGGCYVMEDLHFHADFAHDRRAAPNSALPKSLIQEIGGKLMDFDRGGRDRGWRKYLAQSVDRIEIISKAALIWKVDRQVVDFDAIDASMKDVAGAWHWENYANLLMRHGEAARAQRAAKRALELSPQSWRAHRELAVAYAAAGEVAEAAAEFDLALELAPAAEAAQLQLLKSRLKPPPAA